MGMDESIGREQIRMSRTKKEKPTLEGGQLLARGDVIQLMDGGEAVKCKVISCLAAEDGGCFAGLEIIEGPRTGERIDAKLRPGTGCGPGSEA
jgi:hypothetical protein